MRLFGYARVSTSQQSLKIKKQALKKAGVRESRIFYDQLTTSNHDKTNINALLAKVKEGDIIPTFRSKLLTKIVFVSVLNVIYVKLKNLAHISKIY